MIMWSGISETLLSLQASFRVLLENWLFFIYLFVLQFAFAALISKALTDLWEDKETVFTLAFVGGILGAVLFSLLAVLLKVQPTPLAGAAVFLVSLAVLIWQMGFFKGVGLAKWFLVFGLFILLLRLIFIQGLIVPPYADSVTHLRIVDDLLDPARAPRTFYRLAFDLRHYYHVGFHALAAWLSGATSTAPSQAVLILGQYFQTMAVLSIYPLSRILFRNSHFAWMGVVVASLLLPTPSYASNWGKYPAISSMVGIAFVFSLLSIYTIRRTRPTIPFWILTGLAILSAACLHSRSIVVILIALSMALLGPRIMQVVRKNVVERKNVDYEGIIATFLIALVIAFLLLVGESPAPMWLVLTVAMLSALAFYGNFTLAVALFSLTIFMGTGYFISAQWLSLPLRFGRIFDYPFLVIFSFIPLSLLVELAMDGASRFLPSTKAPSLQRWIVILLLVLGFANIAFVQDQHPSDCCVFVDDDDLFAFGWMEENLPANTLVGIAATGQAGNFLPSDGGAWIEYFTPIPTRKLDFNLDFSKAASDLCRAGIRYLYLDDLATSFDEYELAEAGGILQFGLGDAKVYRLKCEEAR